MMGWSMPSGEEKFSQQEMIENFNIARVSLGGPIFDIEKLDWLNGKYIREDLDDDAFRKLFSEWAFNDEKVRQIVPLIKQRVERFSDVAKIGSFFVSGELDLNVVDFANKDLDTDAELKILQYSLWELEALKQWDREAIESCLLKLCVLMELKIRDFLIPLFVSISGNAVSTSVIESILILKLDITRARIRKGIVVLGGISKKQAKLLEKEYRAFS
jgi:glutamyl-tRNA synthetase